MTTLSRDECNRRLTLIDKVLSQTDGGNVHLREESEALETALALYDRLTIARTTEANLHDEIGRAQQRLALADALAKAAESRLQVWTRETYQDMVDALNAYREARDADQG